MEKKILKFLFTSFLFFSTHFWFVALVSGAIFHFISIELVKVDKGGLKFENKGELMIVDGDDKLDDTEESEGWISLKDDEEGEGFKRESPTDVEQALNESAVVDVVDELKDVRETNGKF